MQPRHVLNKLREVVRITLLPGPPWLQRLWPLLAFALVFGGALIFDGMICRFAFECSGRAEELRYAGWLLDVFGIVVIFWGISERLRSADQGPLGVVLMRSTGDLIRALPQFQDDQPPIHASSASFKLTGQATMVSQGRISPPGQSVEQKVDELEKLLLGLMGRAEADRQRTESKFRDAAKEVRSVQDRINAEIARLTSESKRESVRFISWEIVGVSWILFGITFATAPELVLALFASLSA